MVHPSLSRALLIVTPRNEWDVLLVRKELPPLSWSCASISIAQEYESTHLQQSHHVVESG